MGDLIHIDEPLQVEIIDDKTLKLLRNFAYTLPNSSVDGVKEVIVVPTGFISNGQNFLGSRIKCDTYTFKLSIMHEYLCSLDNERTNFSRQEADEIIYEAVKNRYSFFTRFSVLIFLKFHYVITRARKLLFML